jgi:hypothetical protein
MAHYALLDENNYVINVITGVDEDITQIDLDGTKVGGSSEAWEEFYKTRPWLNAANCKRTSYNGKIRKNYAGIGFFYDSVLDAFIAPKPFESWILDKETCQWRAPKDKPDNDKYYYWDETSLNWVSGLYGTKN